MVLLTLLVGAVQIGCGILRLGALTHFIFNAVMTGFFAGVAVRIILGQLPDLTGFGARRVGVLPQTRDLLLHPTAMHPPTLALGMLIVALILLLERTRLAPVAMVVALATAATAVPLLDWSSVPLVGNGPASLRWWARRMYSRPSLWSARRSRRRGRRRSRGWRRGG